MNSICIITALPAEARVFIDELRLRPLADHGWRLYGNGQYLLLQTGIGKLKAAAATGALLHSRPDIIAVINAGVAGGTPPTGTCMLAHKITDTGSGACWHPHLPPRRLFPSLESSEVTTLDEPSQDYVSGVMFDMEAAGILSACVYYLSTDAIQCIKVISDNIDSPAVCFSKEQATSLMKATVAPALQLADWYLQTGATEHSTEQLQARLDAISSAVHHTANDRHQLKRLLYRQYSLTGEIVDIKELHSFARARDIRNHLVRKLSDVPLRYESGSL